jgi:oligopeptide/dipeptide ABC transporter ATP-binding protein
MYLGRLVEQGTVRDVIRRPAHPYTRGLLAALPTLDDLDAPLTPIPGDIPSPLERPPGCVYHTRCQEVVGPRCAAEIPQFSQVDNEHRAACHLYDQKRATA